MFGHPVRDDDDDETVARKEKRVGHAERRKNNYNERLAEEDAEYRRLHEY